MLLITLLFFLNRAVQLSYNVFDNGDPILAFKRTSINPVIIIPGLFGSKTNWNSLSKTISQKTGRNVIGIDVRNHGESEWNADFSYAAMHEDLLLLMDQLNITKVNLIGHSLGGRVAMNTALLTPDCVEKLVVVDVSPVRMSPEAANLLYMIQRMKAFEFPTGVQMSQVRKMADEALKSIADNPSIRQFLITNIRQNEDKTFQWRLNLDAIEKGMANITDHQFPETVFNAPTLFIGGTSSDYLKPDHHDDILEFFPKAEFNYIKDAGHWLHAEKPDEFLDIVCPFLKI
uniref:sn-1-specific diacylglycerol lipase ABHD11 n=1 Tax=Strigamia maritima TaxID=126957 RepID=T1J2L5_STRMM